MQTKRKIQWLTLFSLVCSTQLGFLQENPLSRDIRYDDSDSVFTHYQIQIGNLWDYSGSIIDNFYEHYPRLVFRTVVAETLHTDGHSYKVIAEHAYSQQAPYGDSYTVGTLGNHTSATVLQRIDSLSTDVYVIGEDFDFGQYYDRNLAVRLDTLLALPNTEFDAFPKLMPNQFAFIIHLLDFLTKEIFGQERETRSLFLGSLVTTNITTAAGLGEYSRSNNADGGQSYYELSGAVINDKQFGKLLRYEPPEFALSHRKIEYGNAVDSIRIVLKNPGLGLTIIDSAKVNTPADFCSHSVYFSYYRGWTKYITQKNTGFSKGPFFVFPGDSLFIDLFVQPEALNSSLKDTLHFFARGIEGTTLPTVSIPISYSVLVSVEQDYDEKNPSEFQMGQNYPNPFNAQTQISYSLSKATEVELTIYNVEGQKVKTLVSEFQTAGQKSIVWNGLDDSRTAVSSGLYFFQLRAGVFQETKKVILIR